MNCIEARQLLQACADGEIGAADSVRLERHLEDCGDCVVALRELRVLRKTVRQGAGYYRASPALRARVLAALPADTDADADADAGLDELAPDIAVPLGGSAVRPNREPAGAATVGPADVPARETGWRRWFTWSPPVNAAMATVTVAAVGLGIAAYAMRESSTDLTADAIVASHVRALLSTREIDVASTDRHTVKPWFNGRIDYAPEVRDLAAEGFPLVGGRLDYVDGRRVAVLIYRRNQHPLEVYVLPEKDRGDRAARVVQGYEMESWSARGMRYWAVTDASGGELRAFVAAWQRAAD